MKVLAIGALAVAALALTACKSDVSMTCAVASPTALSCSVPGYLTNATVPIPAAVGAIVGLILPGGVSIPLDSLRAGAPAVPTDVDVYVDPKSHIVTLTNTRTGKSAAFAPSQ